MTLVVTRRETRQVDQFEICCNSPGVQYGGLVQVLTVREEEGTPPSVSVGLNLGLKAT